MPELLIRNLREETLAELSREAATRGRTVEEEALRVLEQAVASRPRAKTNNDDFWAKADEIRESLRGIPQTDSAELRRIGRRGDE